MMTIEQRLEQLELQNQRIEHKNKRLTAAYNKTGEEVVQLRADEYGNGLVGAYHRKGMGRTLKPGP